VARIRQANVRPTRGKTNDETPIDHARMPLKPPSVEHAAAPALILQNDPVAVTMRARVPKINTRDG
jgi:hypothetical protein